MFTLHISTTNAAFAEDGHSEIARLLRDVADKIATHGVVTNEVHRLRDVNGNAVGHFRLVEE